MLRKQERRGQVDGKRGIPRLEIDVLPTLYVRRARVGDKDVDAAQLAGGLCDKSSGRGRVGQVRRCGDGTPAEVAGIAGSLLGVVAV